jgi:hypothetical protein
MGMKWFMLMAILLWLAVWLMLTAWFAARRRGTALVMLFQTILPVLSAGSLLLLFAAVPRRGMIFALVLWLHHAAIFGLFVFLLSAEFFQAQVWWQIRENAEGEAVAATVHRLWILTEVAPAPLALAIFLTGLRLIWESPANSPDSLWLLILIAGFSFFFFDGLLGYTPIVRRMLAYWETVSRERTSVRSAARAWHCTRDQLQLAAHCLSWPLLFMAGFTRWERENWLSRHIIGLEGRLSVIPDGWRRVTVAIALWIVAGMVVVLLRVCRRSRN